MTNSDTLGSEQAVIGAIIQDPRLIKSCHELTSDHFSDPQCKQAFETILDLDADGDEISILSVADRCATLPTEYFASIVSAVTTPRASIRYHTNTLIYSYKKYKVLDICNNIIQDIHQGIPLEELLSTLGEFVSAHGLTGKLSDRIESWVYDTNGAFWVTECDKDLGIVTKRDKANRRQIFKRLVDRQVIESNGKNGCYRKIDSSVVTLDFKKAEGKEIDIRFFFGFERYVKIRPKNIIVIAGSPDAGKTALLLNFIMLNDTRHKITYFCSEGGADELKSRLLGFEDIPIEKWRFHAIERSSNFADVIRPDEINIIDFLEITDNFFRIAQAFIDIHNKLQNGIAIIAIQKKPGATSGRGDSFSLEKPRLYFTVDADYPGAILRVTKAKNWRDPRINPNGLAMKFKIVNGCKLLPKSDWSLE